MRRFLFPGLALLASLLVVAALSGPARGEASAEPGHPAEGTAAEKPHNEAGGGHGEGHMTPLFHADLGIWTAVIFLIVLGILYWKAWPLVLEGLQRREQSIAGALEDARKAREEAEQLRGQLRKELDHAHEKVREIMDEGRKRAEASAQAIVEKAHADIQADRERLHREINLSKDQALKEIWTQTATLAALVSEKTIRRHLTPEDHRRLVDEAITDLRRSVEERRRETNGQSA